jgi:predicted O-linked N-acetylglucosamine transferase (SPINDLY family)
LFQKCETLAVQGEVANALKLYQAYVGHEAAENKHMAYFNMGSLQQSQGDTVGAEASYRASIAINPSLAQATINLGLLLEKTGRKPEALIEWAKVSDPASGTPEFPKDMQTMALNHMGRVLEDHKQYELAEKTLARSLALDTKQTGVLQHWIHIRQKSCAWPVYAKLPGISRNDMLMATSPLAMLALTDDPVQQLLTAHAFVGRTYGFKEEFLSNGRVYTHDKLRIGYVSGDLCTHAVGLLLPELLEGHDHSQFEIYGYDFSPEDGTAVRTRLKACFDHLRPIHTLTDRQVAEMVLADEIDVLIDLHGLSAGARPGIFALHPAPKQGTYLGFIGTTGMPWFDFVIADRYCLPEELTPYFTEKPLYVEGSFIPLTRDETPVRDAKRSEFDLPEDAFVMAAFGNVYKITPEMFATWMDILKEIPRAVLWLIDDNATTTANLKAHALKASADVERILFTPRASHEEYRAKLNLADVFLDTFPYNCGSTTNDVINAGVPLVTMSGKTMVSRMGGSVLSMFKGQDNLALNFDQYKKNCYLTAASNSKIKVIYQDRRWSLADIIERHVSGLK